MEKPVDIDVLAAQLRPIVGDNGALHPHTIDKLRPHLGACPVPAAVHVKGEHEVRLANEPMRTLLEKDSDLLPIVPMHFRSPLNAMAHSSMSYNFSGGSTAPFASLLSMGSEDTAMALRWQVRHIGRAQGWPVLLSCLTVLVPAMSDPDGDAVIPADPRLKELSPREQQIFRLMRADMLHDEIMRMLKISPDTLCTHKRNILRKLGVRTPMGLLGLFAPELG